MLVLEVIAQGPSYGYEIAQTVAGRSGGTFEMKEGSLYLASSPGAAEALEIALCGEADGRRRKYYELTEHGEKELATRRQSWLRFAVGINGVLGTNQPGWAEG